MNKGIEPHKWGCYQKSHDRLISTCTAQTLLEAESYFEGIELVVGDYVEVRILNQNNNE